MTQIAILDYGVGNLRSVEKALERVGAEASITGNPAMVRDADGVILPGVGAFPAAIRRVRELGLDALVAERLWASAWAFSCCSSALPSSAAPTASAWCRARSPSSRRRG